MVELKLKFIHSFVHYLCAKNKSLRDTRKSQTEGLYYLLALYREEGAGFGETKNSMVQKGNVGKSVGKAPEEQVKEKEF